MTTSQRISAILSCAFLVAPYRSRSAQGSSCDSLTGRCAARHAICVDAFVLEGVDSQLSSCQPYRCINGMCQQQCVGNVDCSDGFHRSGSRCIAD